MIVRVCECAMVSQVGCVSVFVCLVLLLEFELWTYSWYDQGIPQGEELQSFVSRYELSLRRGGPAGTIEEYHEVTSYRVVSCVTT